MRGGPGTSAPVWSRLPGQVPSCPRLRPTARSGLLRGCPVPEGARHKQQSSRISTGRRPQRRQFSDFEPGTCGCSSHRGPQVTWPCFPHAGPPLTRGDPGDTPKPLQNWQTSRVSGHHCAKGSSPLGPGPVAGAGEVTISLSRLLACRTSRDAEPEQNGRTEGCGQGVPQGRGAGVGPGATLTDLAGLLVSGLSCLRVLAGPAQDCRDRVRLTEAWGCGHSHGPTLH